MAEIKFTKNELRAQQVRLQRLEKYLPTLQLKKAMLQAQVHLARMQIEKILQEYEKQRGNVEHYCALLTQKTAVDAKRAAKVKEIHKSYENIAGVEIPTFERVDFCKLIYSLYDTPAWVDTVIKNLQDIATTRARLSVAEEKKRALEEELRVVSIRVNLFEKILIPRAIKNIKKIKVFLGDQQLAAVSQAKAAKKKIIERKLMKLARV